MKTANDVLKEIFSRIGNAGVSRAYFVAGGNELCVFDCDSQLQKLFLELQAVESVQESRQRLGYLYSCVLAKRGSGYAEVRATCCRSPKEIEASLQTAIDGIEAGLSKVEEEFEGMREGYAAISNHLNRIAAELGRCNFGKSPKATRMRYWRIDGDGETLGAISSPTRRAAIKAARKVFGEVHICVERVSKSEFMSIQSHAGRIVEFLQS